MQIPKRLIVPKGENRKKISMALIITIQVLYDLSKEILKVDLLFIVMATIM